MWLYGYMVREPLGKKFRIINKNNFEAQRNFEDSQAFKNCSEFKKFNIFLQCIFDHLTYLLTRAFLLSFTVFVIFGTVC